MTRVLFEACEATGITRAELTAPLDLDAAYLFDPTNTTDWTTLTLLLDRLAELVGGEPERLRAVGRKMLRAPAYAPLQTIAQHLVSARALYEIAFRWVTPASFPHLTGEISFPGENRLRFQGEIPEPHAACKPFMHVTEGCVASVPELLGMPAARIVESHVTPRTIDIVLDVPESRSIVTRIVRRVRGALRTEDMFGALEAQRIQLEDAMTSVLRARDELRVVMDRFPDLVLVHRQAKIVWANKALLQALGYEHLDEIVGKHLFDISLRKSRPDLEGRLRAARENSAAANQMIEVWLVGKTGNELLVEVPPAQEVLWGSVPARLVVGRDITERVRMQQRLLTADRLASIGLLGAGVAHEMNNPLGYVLVNIEMARKDLLAMGTEGERARQALTTALEGVDRMRAIVRDLLVLSRGEKVSAVPTDVGAVVDSTLALAAEEIRKKARLVREAKPAPLARASEGRVAQVVLNLVSNALQAMPEDGENELLVRTAPAEDGRVMLEVRDNGVGIPAEHLPRVFEPFFTTKDGRGTGLGLPITQRLVVDLGGEIAVQSSAKGGTSVRVFLPTAS